MTQEGETTQRQLEQPTLKDILREAAKVIRQRRESHEIIGLRRKRLPTGGGEYLSEEVIGYRP